MKMFLRKVTSIDCFQGYVKILLLLPFQMEKWLQLRTNLIYIIHSTQYRKIRVDYTYLESILVENVLILFCALYIYIWLILCHKPCCTLDICYSYNSCLRSTVQWRNKVANNSRWDHCWCCNRNNHFSTRRFYTELNEASQNHR